MVVQGDSSEKHKGCVFCTRVWHTLIYSLTNVSSGLQCHLISQIPVFLKLVAAPLNHAMKSVYRVFSLTCSASMQIYWNKRERLHKKRVQLPEDWFGTPTWPPFHCFGTPIWPPWRHVKTLYNTRISRNHVPLLNKWCRLELQSNQVKRTPQEFIDPLSPNGEQHQFSPNNIHMLLKKMVIRVNKMITTEKTLWSVIKLSQLIL